MARVTKEMMEKDEQKVIKELQKNSSESLDKLAKRCGFSRQKVWRMIKKLEDTKAVWGYTAIVDNEVQEIKRFVLLMKGNQWNPSLKIPSEITIESRYYINGGGYDWMAIFTAPNIIEAKKFCNKLERESLLIETLFVLQEHQMKNPDLIEKLNKIL